MSRAPAFQWYPGDFQRDNAVRLCTFEARGLWREMLDLMHFGEPRGHLTAGASLITPDELARVVGLPVARVRKLITELEARHVFSRTDDGVIYSRRMIRDEHIAQVRRNAGSKGGKNTAQSNADARDLLKQAYEQTGEQTPKQTGEQKAPPAVCSLQSASAPTTATTPVADAPRGVQDVNDSAKIERPVSLVATRRSKHEPAPFMGALQPVWKAAYGGSMLKGSATQLRPVVDEIGLDEVVARFTAYCKATVGQFASVPRFCQTHGSYSRESLATQRLPTTRAGWMQEAHRLLAYFDARERIDGRCVTSHTMAYDRARMEQLHQAILADSACPPYVTETLLRDAIRWGEKNEADLPFFVATYLETRAAMPEAARASA